MRMALAAMLTKMKTMAATKGTSLASEGIVGWLLVGELSSERVSWRGEWGFEQMVRR